ncbi:MAG: hypothetical protein P1V36_11435 [Planctomycetota bacterium]|nr:hypothetical protein [Planctomycetota bacterium]
MDEPRLPPAVAGRSALPTFLAVEAWARQKTAAAHEQARLHLEEAQAEAERVRTTGEDALKEAVLEGEREALRDVESRTRDRISAARTEVTSWINRSEEAAQQALDEAMAILCGETPSESPTGAGDA